VALAVVPGSLLLAGDEILGDPRKPEPAGGDSCVVVERPLDPFPGVGVTLVMRKEI
jgi:hypothetical protein